MNYKSIRPNGLAIDITQYLVTQSIPSNGVTCPSSMTLMGLHILSLNGLFNNMFCNSDVCS